MGKNHEKVCYGVNHLENLLKYLNNNLTRTKTKESLYSSTKMLVQHDFFEHLQIKKCVFFPAPDPYKNCQDGK
jgi:hypothetical protein